MINDASQAVVTGAESRKSVADPIVAYESMVSSWKKSRAVCQGEAAVKEYDAILDTNTFTNLLIPFSPTMTPEQYRFYKSEAELPGITSQYAKIIVGGLLRKQPTLELPKDAPSDAKDWILDHFSQDSSPLMAFLDNALWEEMQTSRTWVYVDYPFVAEEKKATMTQEDFDGLKPYPVLWKAESIVNWQVETSSLDGTQRLKRIIRRAYEEVFDENDPDQFHPELRDTVWVHEIVNGFYQIRKFQKKQPIAGMTVTQGSVNTNYEKQNSPGFELVDTINNIEANGERLAMIPAWPLNGSIEPIEPILMPIINREIALYNKVSRRNHLLHGAATFTPYVASDMEDEKFDDIVSSGLGAWLRVRQGDTIGVVETPTAALQDMATAIKDTIEEMARMGIRMLSPETNDQSGVALEIRNAAQTAQLGTLNTKVSNQMADIIAFMINWRYGTEYTSSDVHFQLSADFDPVPLGDQYLRLATEWYQGGLIPRSVWIAILKQNDMLAPDYDDEEGQSEINQDELVVTPREDMNFQADMQQQLAAVKTGQPANPMNQ